MDKLSEMKARSERGFTDQSQAQRDYGSNPPAPHGKPFVLFDAINTIRDLRSPQNGGLRGGPAVNAPGARGADSFPLRREENVNIGPFTPIAKLLKKVCEPKSTRVTVIHSVLIFRLESFVLGHREHAVGGGDEPCSRGLGTDCMRVGHECRGKNTL